MPPVRYHSGLFPPTKLDWTRLVPLIGPANAAIARYDGVLSAVPNVMVLLSPMTTQEAVLSSRIEGTQASMSEVLEYEAGAGPSAQEDSPKAADIREIINYRRAILAAGDELGRLPLCIRVVKKAHAMLLDRVRGQTRAPGQFRRIQNWIGPVGTSQDQSRYMPIAANELDDGMSRWEKYLQSREPDCLVQLAVLHAEFEALHPFLDGNGRLGRMLIPIFLFERKLLASPTFYLSGYLEARREEYYERLLRVSRDGDWTGWCVFFLEALLAQGAANTERARAILDLYKEKKTWIADRTRSKHAIRALDFIFSRPVFNASDFVSHAGIPAPTAKRIVKVLRDSPLLKVLRHPSGRRPAVLAFSELVNLTEGRQVL